MIIQTENTAAK